MPLGAIVEHAEAVIITFDQHADDGRDPADDGDEREEEDTDRINRLPCDVTEGDADAAADVAEHLDAVKGELIFATIDKRFCLLAKIGEQRGADDEKQIFE